MAVAMFVLGLCMIVMVAAAIAFFICYGVTGDNMYGGLCFAALVVLSMIAVAEAILTIINLAQVT